MRTESTTTPTSLDSCKRSSIRRIHYFVSSDSTKRSTSTSSASTAFPQSMMPQPNSARRMRCSSRNQKRKSTMSLESDVRRLVIDGEHALVGLRQRDKHKEALLPQYALYLKVL